MATNRYNITIGPVILQYNIYSISGIHITRSRIVNIHKNYNFFDDDDNMYIVCQLATYDYHSYLIII